MSTATTPSSAKSLNANQRDWLKQMSATLGTRSTAGTADKALVGGIFDLVPDPITSTITIKNNSPFILQIVPNSAKPESPPSDFIKGPPLEIAANRGEGTFTISNKLLGKIPSPGGTGGQVQYQVVGDPNRTRLFFKWERGFLFPSRETTQTVTPKDDSKFKVEGFNSGGDDFAFIFTAVGAVPPPGPLPGPTPVGPDAASSCMVTITNDTKLVLTLGNQGHERGDFMTFPVKTLQPGGNTSFVSVETPNSKDPKDEGCKGFTLWQVGSPNTLWRVEWDNPEGSKNTVSASFNPPNAGFTSLNQIGQGEENVPVAFTISGGGGGQTPPTPNTATKLTITVLDANGDKPIKGATVEIKDIDGKTADIAKKSATTGADGKVEFDLPPSSGTTAVNVRVTAAGFDAEGRIFKLPEDGFRQIVHMKSATRVRNAIFNVLDTSQSKPLQGATIEISGKSIKSDERGFAEIEMPAGQFPFVAKATGFLDNSGKITTSSDKDTFENVLMVAKTTTGKLLVTVTDDASKPVEGATVAVSDKTAKTDNAGKTNFDLPAGDHKVQVTADGFEEGRVAAAVKSGEKTDVSVFLQSAPEPEFKPPVEAKQPTIRKGDKPNKDGWVEYLQKLLTSFHKIAQLEINGTYDKPTQDAVIAFQKKNKLQVDGTVGNQTWAALRQGAPENVGTDGRKPGTFVEKGAEARWAEERDVFVFTSRSDELIMALVSVGDTKIDDFEITVRVTPPNTKPKVVKVRIGKPAFERPGGGADHVATLPKFKKTFPATDPKAKVEDYKVEAFLPQELGGDLYNGNIVVVS